MSGRLWGTADARAGAPERLFADSAGPVIPPRADGARPGAPSGHEGRLHR